MMTMRNALETLTSATSYQGLATQVAAITVRIDAEGRAPGAKEMVNELNGIGRERLLSETGEEVTKTGGDRWRELVAAKRELIEHRREIGARETVKELLSVRAYGSRSLLNALRTFVDWNIKGHEVEALLADMAKAGEVMVRQLEPGGAKLYESIGS